MIKRKLNRRLIFECRCDERLKAKVEGSTTVTHLVYTGCLGGLEHLKIETRLILCDGSGTGHGHFPQANSETAKKSL